MPYTIHNTTRFNPSCHISRRRKAIRKWIAAMGIAITILALSTIGVVLFLALLPLE